MDQIGRYEILNELGRGAMGVVYLARDTKIGREVAIKTIKLADQADESETERLRERLFREAQSAGRLTHPGIVTIYDVAEEAGLAYITMEFVDGETLQAMMDSGRAEDPEFISDILRQTASALDYAHSKEIVHRDVKPANIMVTADGTVKITDFGIARISSSKLTQTGTVMGTPSYMSPEQVRGDPIDGSSDQFSLGVITYELLTDEKPFAGDSLTAVMFKIVSGDVRPPSEISSGISEPLESAVLRALSKSGGERFPSCASYSEAVAAGLQSPVAAALEGQTGTAEFNEEPNTAAMPAMTGTAAAVSPEQSDETVVRRLPEETAATVALQGMPPLGATDAQPQTYAEEEEEPKRGGFWLAIAVVAGILVAGGGYWLSQNPGFFGGAAGTVASTPEAEPVETGATGEGATIAEGTGETGIASSTPPVVPVTPPLTPPESATPDPGSAAARTPAETAPAAEIPVTPPPEPKPTPPRPAPRKAAPPKLTAVNMGTPQPGARVVVDGKPQWSCTTPCSIDLPRGEHTAIASLTGFYRVRKPFEVGDDPLDLALDLEAVLGTLLVSSSPVGADVFVDGKMIDEKTNTSLRLPPGYHLIKVQKAGAGNGEQSVLVNEGDLQTKQFSLSTSPRRAKLIVKTTPPGATIELNDRDRHGVTPAELDLPPGSYRISLTLAGHRPFIKDIELPASGPVAIDEPLSPRN